MLQQLIWIYKAPSTPRRQATPRQHRYFKSQEEIFQSTQKGVEKSFPDGHYIGRSDRDNYNGYSDDEDEYTGHSNKDHYARYVDHLDRKDGISSVRSSVLNSNKNSARVAPVLTLDYNASHYTKYAYEVPVGNKADFFKQKSKELIKEKNAQLVQEAKLIKEKNARLLQEKDSKLIKEKNAKLIQEKVDELNKKMEAISIKTGDSPAEPKKDFSFINMKKLRETKEAQLVKYKEMEITKKEAEDDAKLEAKILLEEDGWDLLEDEVSEATRTVKNGKADIVKPKGWFGWF